jgi:hypothetical protein
MWHSACGGRLGNFDPPESLHTKPIASFTVNEYDEHAVTRAATNDATWRERLHIQVLAAELRDRATGGARAAS